MFGPITNFTGQFYDFSLRFSPDGRVITFMDRGPGPADEDAPQVAHAGLVLAAVLGHFGRRRSTAPRRYAESEGGERERGSDTWTAVAGHLLLGDRWVDRQKRRLKGVLVAAEVAGQKRLRGRPPLCVVIPQVCRAAKVDKETLLRPRGARGTWARRVARWLSSGRCAG